jgi:hypothetical protein
MLLRRSPSQASPREALLQRAAAAQQHLQELLTQQAVGGAALSALPESAQGVVKSALLKLRQQAELLVQQQAEQLERTVVPAVKAEVRRRPCRASACIFGHDVLFAFCRALRDDAKGWSGPGPACSHSLAAAAIRLRCLVLSQAMQCCAKPRHPVLRSTVLCCAAGPSVLEADSACSLCVQHP